MKDRILIGHTGIDYHITFVNRKTLGIIVNPDMQVIVKAPHGSPAEKIRALVKKRAGWILKQQSFFLGFYPKNPPRRYVSGETQLYLGRQYMLKVTTGKKNEVHYKGRYIGVTTSDRSKTGALLKAWYRRKAKEKFAEIAEPLILRFRKYGVEPRHIYLQEMKTRWGSCTASGKIILNPELIKAPRPCIEYVIVHELCHLVHHNHTRKFMELQAREMPDWERWKLKLEMLLA